MLAIVSAVSFATAKPSKSKSDELPRIIFQKELWSIQIQKKILVRFKNSLKEHNELAKKVFDYSCNEDSEFEQSWKIDNNNENVLCINSWYTDCGLGDDEDST